MMKHTVKTRLIAAVLFLTTLLSFTAPAARHAECLFDAPEMNQTVPPLSENLHMCDARSAHPAKMGGLLLYYV